jgi:heme-degrading monooxygenase HmoA
MEMIARLWTTSVIEARLDEYEAFARDISLPMFQKAPGCQGVLMFRDGPACHVLTLWRSQPDIDALETSPAYVETVRRILSAGFLTGLQTTRTFQTHLDWMA